MSQLIFAAWVLAGAVLILPVGMFLRLARRLAGRDRGDRVTAVPEAVSQPKHRLTRRLAPALIFLLYVAFVAGAVYHVPKILSWALDTPYPMASVSSQSMWPTLKKGDLIFLSGVDKPEDLEIGDIIAFEHKKGITIHRVLEVDGDAITTQGDGNPVPDKSIRFEQVVGRLLTVGGRLAKVPRVGSIAGLFGPLATQAGQSPEQDQLSAEESSGLSAPPEAGEPAAEEGSAGGEGNASSGTTELVSIDSAGNQANGPSTWPVISADGRFVAFVSAAGNLVPDDTNGQSDVFVHDRQTGATERVSVDSAGNQANASSDTPAISADGRFVAFVSAAPNLVPDDTNAESDIFVHDRETGITTRLSVDSEGNQADGSSHAPAISADGRFVAFVSAASNLVPGDTNAESDVFVHDRQTGITERVSVDSNNNQADASSTSPAISADGRFIAFESAASNLVPDDTNGESDVFVHDRQSGATKRVSVDSDDSQADGSSTSPAISADGRFVAFESKARNLVPRDFNRDQDVFVHDRQTGATERVSVSSAGKQSSAPTSAPAISADGSFVAFHAGHANLVPGDTNRFLDVFVHDRQTGATERVSVDNAGNQGNDHSGLPAISGDGRFVAFWSWATNLVPVETKQQIILVRDRRAAGDNP
ncbi:MAG: signal peptidase I [Dehalococcoidia bacterium]